MSCSSSINFVSVEQRLQNFVIEAERGKKMLTVVERFFGVSWWRLLANVRLVMLLLKKFMTLMDREKLCHTLSSS